MTRKQQVLLAICKGHHTVLHLSKELDMYPNAISGILQTLADEQLVQRRRSANRTSFNTLTQTGYDELQHLHQERVELNNELYQALADYQPAEIPPAFCHEELEKGHPDAHVQE